MRKILSVFAAVCAVWSSHAQPVLNAANNTPVPGETYYRTVCLRPGVTTKDSGANVTWDYSDLTTNSYDSIQCLSCSGTPHCDTFPLANLVLSRSGIYQYCQTGVKMFSTLGVIGTGVQTAYYGNPESVMIYPLGFLDTKSDSFFVNQPGASLFTYGRIDFHSDAYGTLIIPSGVFFKCVACALSITRHRQ